MQLGGRTTFIEVSGRVVSTATDTAVACIRAARSQSLFVSTLPAAGDRGTQFQNKKQGCQLPSTVIFEF